METIKKTTNKQNIVNRFICLCQIPSEIQATLKFVNACDHVSKKLIVIVEKSYSWGEIWNTQVCVVDTAVSFDISFVKIKQVMTKIPRLKVSTPKVKSHKFLVNCTWNLNIINIVSCYHYTVSILRLDVISPVVHCILHRCE